MAAVFRYSPTLCRTYVALKKKPVEVHASDCDFVFENAPYASSSDFRLRRQLEIEHLLL